MTAQNAQPGAKATPREILLVAAGIASILYGYSRFWHGPNSRQMTELVQTNSDRRLRLQGDLATVERLETEARTQTASDGAVGAGDSKLDQVREVNSNFANIVRELSGVGASERFTIRSLTLSKEEKLADYTRVLFTLEIEAPFLAVGGFLERLEKSDLLTEVVDIDVSRIEKELKRCTIRLSIYSYAARS